MGCAMGWREEVISIGGLCDAFAGRVDETKRRAVREARTRDVRAT